MTVMPKKLVVVSLWSEDVAKLVHFYRDVIGLTLKDWVCSPFDSRLTFIERCVKIDKYVTKKA